MIEDRTPLNANLDRRVDDELVEHLCACQLRIACELPGDRGLACGGDHVEHAVAGGALRAAFVAACKRELVRQAERVHHPVHDDHLELSNHWTGLLLKSQDNESY